MQSRQVYLTVIIFSNHHHLQSPAETAPSINNFNNEKKNIKLVVCGNERPERVSFNPILPFSILSNPTNTKIYRL